MTEQQTYDLLKPPQLPDLYIHQLKQTIQAYSPSQIVVGEALQNSIDAVYQSGGGDHLIRLNIDFDSRTISIEDDGIGFPNDATLLFLGGTRKREAAKKLFGLVGVGIKVVLFKSRFFMLRSRTEEGAFRLEISDAYRFGNGGHTLQVPTSFPEDSQPLDKSGTQITYTFPEGTIGDPLKQFVQELQVRCLSHGVDRHFGKTLGHSVSQKVFPNRFAALFCAFLRRFTYAGDVMNQLGNKPELSNTKLKVQISCSNPMEQFGSEMGGLFDGNTKFEFEIKPEYLLVEDVFNWVPTHVRLGLYREALGKGGEGLSRTFKGFNVLRYVEAEDYEKLITDQQGNLADDIEEYREKLFPQINGIILTIGRIPHFDEFLPGGSRRVLSANGVVTSHDLDLTRGRNLEYVRCFDMVIDLDAKLNYGKTQLTDLYLVNRARRFVNDAYASVIQRAAGNWVGRIPPDTGDELDNFLSRPDLGLPDYILRKAPTDENDVIALFFELAGRGFFPNIGYSVCRRRTNTMLGL